MKNVIVGTAGHIDHGKSALVESLTGTNPDRLEEERRRGITIDLGFAFLELDGLRIGFVDVPGHERFVRNMLAGVAGFDLVMLVVAADESVMPQTREHFDICRLLEIPRGLAVITKTDLVDAEQLTLVRLELEEFLRGSFLESAPIGPVSARTGAGLDALRDELLRAGREAPGKDASRVFRLPVDRAFAMKGFGAVVTGTLVSGSVAPDDEVELFPARRRVRVRGVQSGGEAQARAVAGQRTAVNLAGVDLAELKRGMVLAAPVTFEATQRMDARITLLASARKLKNRARVHLHHFTAETMAEVVLFDRGDLAPGESCFAQLRLGDALLALPGDRFILRQFSPVVTIGGGVVLDALAPKHRAGDAGRAGVLETLARGNRAETLSALVSAEPDGMRVAGAVARTGWLASEVRETALALAQAGNVRVIGDAGGGTFVMVSTEAFDACKRRVRDEVERFHAGNPLLPGIPKEDLRERAMPGRTSGASLHEGAAELFRAALDAVVASGELVAAGDTVKRAGREIALLPEEARAKEQIEGAFARAGLAVPPVKEVLARLEVETKRAQKILQILLREQALVKVAEDLLFHRVALQRLRELLAKYKMEKGERLSVGVFKELTGVSRKYAIPLLEYLDRERVTRRAGDERIIL